MSKPSLKNAVINISVGAYNRIMLKLEEKQFHIVKTGQSVRSIAQTYQIPERLLVKENGLTKEPRVGNILLLPKRKGDYYTAQAGDCPSLLCGSEEKFKEKNGGKILYPELKVWL